MNAKCCHSCTFVGDLAANILHPSSFSGLTDTTVATPGKSPFGMPTQKMELFVESDSTEAMVNQAPAVVYTHPLPTREGETLGEIEGDGLFYV